MTTEQNIMGAIIGELAAVQDKKKCLEIIASVMTQLHEMSIEIQEMIDGDGDEAEEIN